jgi:hypothetical protein
MNGIMCHMAVLAGQGKSLLQTPKIMHVRPLKSPMGATPPAAQQYGQGDSVPVFDCVVPPTLPSLASCSPGRAAAACCLLAAAGEQKLSCLFAAAILDCIPSS